MIEAIDTPLFREEGQEIFPARSEAKSFIEFNPLTVCVLFPQPLTFVVAKLLYLSEAFIIRPRP